MPRLDSSFDVVFEGRKILSRGNLLPSFSSSLEELLHLSASITSSSTASASEVEAALEVLVYLSLHSDNREAISSALEKTATDSSSVSMPSSEVAKACLLALFLRLSPSYSLSATDLLELSPNRQLSGAVSLIVALLNWRPPKHQCSDLNELQAACLRLFWGLTLPETLFTVGNINLSETETDATPISELTNYFNDGMNELISLVLDTDILSGSIRAIKPWIIANTTMRLKMRMEIASGGITASSLEDFNGAGSAGELDGVFHSFVGFLLRATHNLLLFSTEAQAKLRTHIANGVVLEIFLPYTQMCIAAITAVEDAISTSEVTRAEELKPVMQTLLSSLYASFSLLSVASFKIRVLRPSLRDGRLISSALQVRSISLHVPSLAAIFSLTINADVLLKIQSLSSSSSVASTMKASKKLFGPKTIATGVSVNHTLKSILVSCVEDLPIDDRRRFEKRLREIDSYAMPTVKSGTSYDHLREYAWPDESLVSESKVEGESTNRSLPNSIPLVSHPLCAITGKRITDPVIIVAKEGELNPSPGSIFGPYVDKNSGEGKESLILFYCEREVVASAIEDAPPEGVPFTLLECERDDPVLRSLQRARLALLLERERQ